MSKTRKRKGIQSKTQNKRNKKHIIKGGIKEDMGLPECTNLSQFQITDENISGFYRYIRSPTDCVINALQLFGLLDIVTSNLLRISAYGFTITKEKIEMMFILFKGNNFDFKSTTNFHEFAQQIETFLKPGYAVFAGYTDHVFILARKTNGVIVLIDPQIPTICDINDCQHLIQRPNSNYFLLFNSPQKLTNQQLQTVGFQI
jgi:hypothetical protein